MADIPQWWMRGDWFDVCSCDIACPCEFAQPPTCDEKKSEPVRRGKIAAVLADRVLHFLGKLSHHCQYTRGIWSWSYDIESVHSQILVGANAGWGHHPVINH